MKRFFEKIFTAIKKAAAFVVESVRSFFAVNDGEMSYREQSKLIKENRKTIKVYEKRKKRRNVPEQEYLTEMKNPDNIVEFEDLRTYFYTDAGVVKSVDGISFSVPKNTTVGIVGESGCGKSVTSLSLMQLVQAPTGQIVGGSIRFQSDEKCYDITKIPMNKMNLIRGKEISMIFQEPMTSLNPVFTIGNQMSEVVLQHEEGADKAIAKEKSIEMLRKVGIAMPEVVFDQYPHELSGGMRQRVMIGMAIICNPKLIIADEPTTALDVTIQAQILELFSEIKKTMNGSLLLITHDLGVIAEMADYVIIMYAGRIIERGTINDIFKNPKHPYTRGLQKSKPVLNKKVDKLYSIPGQVPSPISLPSNCYFKGRCEECFGRCEGEYPPDYKISDTHSVACYLYADEGREEK